MFALWAVVNCKQETLVENELTLQRATPEANSKRLLRLSSTDGKRRAKPALGELPILNLLARYAGLSGATPSSS